MSHVLHTITVLASESGKAEAEHSWLPENAEIIWGGLAFLIIAFALWKFGWPAAKKGLADRSERIQAQLDEAAQARVRADQEVAEVKTAVANLEAERARIVAEAREAAEAVKVEHAARLEEELAEVRAKAVADIESSKTRARTELQASVAHLSMGAAERIVAANLDDTTQQDLVEKFIAGVGGAR